ncbi:hypothetical protein CTI12_AA529740 [Artemisia annua]|uniref:Uncharacterized protein n=1 Tax=Artemisia annua TaxID=35608 RepID=A0A2U1L505_ARTAN|nr:hypothetical protein CTI12_AA529740 [Artemisia annua]
MESKLAIQKGGQVAISVTDDHEQAKPVSPQLFWYYMVLCLMSFFFTFPSTIAPLKLQTIKQHPGGVSVIMTFVTISVTTLASAILVFTSCYLKSYMRIIHYTVLKTVGSLSGILAPFFFEVVLFVPDNPSITVYTLLGVIFVGIMVGYCFLWKYAISYQQGTDFNELSSPWMLFVPALIPLEIVLPPFIPENLYWILPLGFFVQFSILYVAAIRIFGRRQIMPLGTSPAIQQDKRQDQ